MILCACFYSPFTEKAAKVKSTCWDTFLFHIHIWNSSKSHTLHMYNQEILLWFLPSAYNGCRGTYMSKFYAWLLLKVHIKSSSKLKPTGYFPHCTVRMFHCILLMKIELDMSYNCGKGKWECDSHFEYSSPLSFFCALGHL